MYMRTGLWAAGLGLAVAIAAGPAGAGAPKPDVSTPEKFKQALLDAKTVAFSVFRGPLERLRGSADGKIFDPAAEQAFEWLAGTQREDGAWPYALAFAG
jgi:hypothetical protein